MRARATVARLIVCCSLAASPVFAADPPAKADKPKPPANIFDFGGLDPVGRGEGVSPETPATKPSEPPKAEKPPEVIKAAAGPKAPAVAEVKPKEPAKPAVVAKAPEMGKPAVVVKPPEKVPVPETVKRPDAPKAADFDELARLCHVDADGALWVDQTMTFKLRDTEGRDFVVSGEVYPAEGDVLNKTGGMEFFIRETSGRKRYEFSINGLFVKRVLIEGRTVPRFATPIAFAGVPRSQWSAFRIEVGAERMAIQVAGQSGEVKGPLETAGRNSLILAAGAKIRNLKVEIR